MAIDDAKRARLKEDLEKQRLERIREENATGRLEEIRKKSEEAMLSKVLFIERQFLV